MIPERQACLDCGRYAHCNSWAIPPLRPNDRRQQVDLLVVGEYPGAEDDESGIPFQSEPFKELICNPLSKTPWETCFTHVVRCGHIGDKPKPTAVQLRLCAEEFLLPMIRGMRPKCIWAVGAEVARTILNSQLPLNKIRSLGVSYFEDIPVVIIEHPANHSKWKSIKLGGRDLRNEYSRRLELTHRILTGKFVREDVEFTLIKTPDEALEAAMFLRHSCYPVLGFDTEVGLQPDTNFAEQSERVSFLTAGYDGKERSTDKHHTFSIDLENWTREQRYKVLTALAQDKYLLATQCFFDFGMTYWQCEFDVFRSAAGYHDIHLLAWAQNQTAVKNGLEDQCVDYLGWASWKAEMEELEAELVKKIQFESGSLIQDIDYRHLKWNFYDQFMKYQAVDARGTSRLWYDRYNQDPEDPHPSPKFNLNGYRLSLSYVRSLSLMSRYGIPVNVRILKEFQANNQATVQRYQTWLNNHPLTRRVFGTPQVNVKSADQMHKLFVSLGLEARQKTEKTEKNKVDQDELIRQGDIDKEHFMKEGVIRRNARSWDQVQADKVKRDYFYAVLQTRYHIDKNSKSDDLLRHALPLSRHHGLRGTINLDGEELHWLHPFYKIGKIDGTSTNRGGGGVNTGRFSSVWPSVFNIAQDEALRRSFEAPAGWVFCEWDQSAIEPRVFAYLADEPKWKRIFELQADPATCKDKAADVYNVGWADYRRSVGFPDYTPQMVDKAAERPSAKILILRLCYDSSPIGITRQDGLPLELTEPFAVSFWQNYPRLQAFAYRTRKQIIEKGGWLFGCQERVGQYRLFNTYRLDDEKHSMLPLWELQRALNMKEADAEKLRAGMNSLIQGSSADITSTAFTDLINHCQEEQITWMVPIDTVHDNIGCLVREGYVEQADKVVNSIMTDPERIQRHGIKVPFPTTGHRIMRTGWKVGPNRGAALKEVRG